MKFNRGIRRLGLMPDGVSSYLDQFRLLITHIGNALGLVRLVRSGGRLNAAAAVRFVPEAGWALPAFTELAASVGEVGITAAAAQLADTHLESLVESFGGHNPYYSLLVKVFAGQLSGSSGGNSHLELFYLLVPPLAVNYVEAIMAAKERLSRNNVEAGSGGGGAIFTEDGFALGLAFCLVVLGQWRPLDALHWPESVAAYLAAERDKVVGAAKGAAAALAATQALTLRRIEATVREFQLLHFSLTSSRIFFQVEKGAGLEKRKQV